MTKKNKRKNKKILLTGGAGYVGSVLVPLFLRDGYDVRVVDSLMFNQHSPVINLKKTGYEFIWADLCDEKTLKQSLKGVDLIVHLAALVGEPPCRAYPNLCYRLNTELVEKINRLRKKIPIIAMSSSSIYGEIDGGICTEETKPKPTMNYAISKWEAEKIIVKSDNYIIFRPATAFGDSPRPRIDLLPNEFTFIALKQKKLEVYNPNFLRTIFYVKDFARAILMMANRFSEYKNQVFNIGTDELNVTKENVARAIRRKIKFDLKIVPNLDDPDQRNFFVDFGKFKNTGFKPAYTLDRGIDQLIKRYRHLSDHPSYYNTHPIHR